MPAILTALISGTLFGIGLALSQMINPAKVLGFLDLFGSWDPSLALVMGGALAVTAGTFAAIRRRPAPLLAETFRLPGKKEIDARLLSGAAIFGVGWGLAGWCPGPALSSLGLGSWRALVFVAAMGIGMALFRFAPRPLGESAV